jgi:hypothetical protein
MPTDKVRAARAPSTNATTAQEAPSIIMRAEAILAIVAIVVFPQGSNGTSLNIRRSQWSGGSSWTSYIH